MTTQNDPIKQMLETKFNSEKELLEAQVFVIRSQVTRESVSQNLMTLNNYVDQFLNRLKQYKTLVTEVFPMLFVEITDDDDVFVSYKYRIDAHQSTSLIAGIHLAMPLGQAFKCNIVANVETIVKLVEQYPIKLTHETKKQIEEDILEVLKSFACKATIVLPPEPLVDYEQLAYEYWEKELTSQINAYASNIDYSKITKEILTDLTVDRDKLTELGYDKYINEKYVVNRKTLDNLLLGSVDFLDRFGILTTNSKISKQIGELISKYNKVFEHLKKLIMGDIYVTVDANDTGTKSE